LHRLHKTDTTRLQYALEILGLRCKGFDAALTECYAAGGHDILLAQAEPENTTPSVTGHGPIYRDLACFPDARFI
jgi:hypothetical protein